MKTSLDQIISIWEFVFSIIQEENDSSLLFERVRFLNECERIFDFFSRKISLLKENIYSRRKVLEIKKKKIWELLTKSIVVIFLLLYRPKYFSQYYENTKRRRADKQSEGESELGVRDRVDRHAHSRTIR